MSGNTGAFSSLSCAAFVTDFSPLATGFALPYGVRRNLEHFFGADLADVRVHVGDEAPRFGAWSFAHGENIYFAPGQYAPETAAGERLLAHELTHVLQQRTGRARNPYRHAAVLHDPALELEAERVAGLKVDQHRLPPDFAHLGVGSIPGFGCIQMASPSPAENQGQQTQWAKIVQMLSSRESLASVGIIATGALLWYNKDALVTNGIKLGAKAVAAAGSKMFTPRTAANFVLDKFAANLAKPLTPGENIMVAVKGYASLILPGGNLSSALFEGVKLWWNGISTLQSFAIQVFQELPTEWRNEFATECVKGFAAIAVGQFIGNIGTAGDVLGSTVPPH